MAEEPGGAGKWLRAQSSGFASHSWTKDSDGWAQGKKCLTVSEGEIMSPVVNQFLHIVGERGIKGEPFPCNGMIKYKTLRMKSLAGKNSKAVSDKLLVF